MINVDKVSFIYPTGFEALKEIDLRVEDGEFLAIMGENGAGKTTLVKHFNGLFKPTKGDVYINKINTKDTSVAKLARNVGLVFQNPENQFFCETVEKEIEFGLKNFGFEKKEIDEKIGWVIDLLNLERYRDTSPFMLSGGEKKRVALASVLAWDPDILVLDEPTIGQDYEQKEKLRDFVLNMNILGKTIIMVTHDVEFVAECKPRVILISNGKIIADGMAKKILSNSMLLEKASILPPQIIQLFSRLDDLGFPKDIFDIEEAVDYIKAIIGN